MSKLSSAITLGKTCCYPITFSKLKQFLNPNILWLVIFILLYFNCSKI